MGNFAWILQTAEPDSEVIGVFASREALLYEYPTAEQTSDRESFTIRGNGYVEPMFAARYPLHEYVPAAEETKPHA